MNNRHFFKLALKTAFLSVLFLASQAYGLTSYYISSVGSDANDGKSTTTPWKTISKVNSTALASGDAIYFRAGDTFYGQISVNQSGVTLGNYGGSVKPIISGSQKLTGWTVYSGSIYKAQASAFVKNLYANGVQMTLARYPNKGFLTTTSTDGSSTLAASGLNQASGYWNGANVRIRTTAFTFETHQVGSYDGSTISLVPRSTWSYPLSSGYGFYLDNKLAALDVANEWFCDPNTNMVYFFAPGGVNPSSLSVDGSTTDYGINTTQSNLLVQGLDFRYQALAALHFSGTTSGNRILSNTIFGELVYGMYVEGNSSNYTIDGNTLQNIDGRGIYCDNSSQTMITNNTVKSIGLVPGYGIDMDDGMSGIVLRGGSNYVVRGNIIDSTGYTGIRSDGSYNLVENNVVSNAMQKLSDGGAIYAYNENQLTFGTIWRNNVVINVPANIEGLNSPYGEGEGLYWDFRCRDMTAEGNTVVNVASNGLFMQYACYNNTIRNNTFYNCGNNGAFINVNTGYTYTGNRIAGNTFYTKDAAHDGLYLIDLTSTYHPFGTLDSNTYCNPYNSTAVSRVYAPSSNVLDHLTLSAWQSLTGQDTHAKMMYKQPASYERDTIIVNASGATATLPLQQYLYHDLSGNAVSVSLTLPPYSSRILIRDTVQVATPLPVELVSFTLSSKSGAVVLSWKTATEVNNYGYDVEKKAIVPATGSTPQTTVWNKIGFVAGSGTSNIAHDYTFTDPSAPTGSTAYRLKQIDRDGQFQYSKEIEFLTTAVVSDILPHEFALGQNFPNPFNPSTSIAYDIPSHALVLLKIYDVAGREVATLVNQEMETGKYSVQWNASSFPSGVYFYRLTAGNFTSVKKLLLQK